MYWNELIDNIRAPALGEMIWTCNCMSPQNAVGQPLLSKMHTTTVRRDGTCVHCGYYGLRVEKRAMELGRTTLHYVGRRG